MFGIRYVNSCRIEVEEGQPNLSCPKLKEKLSKMKKILKISRNNLRKYFLALNFSRYYTPGGGGGTQVY